MKMKFIKIKEGFSVREDNIDAVEQVKDLTCNIYTSAGMYRCDYPYLTMLSILERKDIEENKDVKETNQLLRAIASNQQRNVA